MTQIALLFQHSGPFTPVLSSLETHMPARNKKTGSALVVVGEEVYGVFYTYGSLIKLKMTGGITWFNARFVASPEGPRGLIAETAQGTPPEATYHHVGCAWRLDTDLIEFEAATVTEPRLIWSR